MKTDLEKMSREELVEMILKLNEDKTELEQQVNETRNELEELRVSHRDMMIRMEELIAKYEELVREKRALEVRPFIPKSEKLKDEDLVINEIEEVKEKKKRRTPSENFLSQLKKAYLGEADDVILDYDFEGNGISRDSVKLFGKDETYKLEYQPGSFRVKRILKNKYRDGEHIYEADSSADSFPHSPLTPSLAANILNMKYELGVPFYRYSQYLSQKGMTISEADICHWAAKSMELLEPLYDRLFQTLISTDINVLHIDETPLKVINEEKTKCYMFVYATSFWEAPIYIYSFSDTRSTGETKEILKDYKGYVICDGYPGYDSLPDQGIKVQRCMIHARRYFNDCLIDLPLDEMKKNPAYRTIELMGKLFNLEKKFRDKKYTAPRIQQERNKPYYLKCIEKLDQQIDSIDPKLNSTLKKAVNYYKNNRKELYTYLENGYVEMENNLAERVVKPFVIARKSFLFCKTADGADVTAKLFSIVQTARANGLKSEQYLSYCLENIRKVPVEELLPWNEKIPAEIRISRRDLSAQNR